MWSSWTTTVHKPCQWMRKKNTLPCASFLPCGWGLTRWGLPKVHDLTWHWQPVSSSFSAFCFCLSDRGWRGHIILNICFHSAWSSGYISVSYFFFFFHFSNSVEIFESQSLTEAIQCVTFKCFLQDWMRTSYFLFSTFRFVLLLIEFFFFIPRE